MAINAGDHQTTVASEADKQVKEGDQHSMKAIISKSPPKKPLSLFNQTIQIGICIH